MRQMVIATAFPRETGDNRWTRDYTISVGVERYWLHLYTIKGRIEHVYWAIVVLPLPPDVHVTGRPPRSASGSFECIDAMPDDMELVNQIAQDALVDRLALPDV